MIHKNWQELIKPQQLVVKAGADAQRIATVTASSMEMPCVDSSQSSCSRNIFLASSPISLHADTCS